MQQTDNGYKYKIDECDVSDKKSLEKAVREKHSEWVNWYFIGIIWHLEFEEYHCEGSLL